MLEVLPVLVGTLFRSGAIVLVWVRVALGVVGVEALMTRRRRSVLECLSKKQLVTSRGGETDLNYWSLLWWFRVLGWEESASAERTSDREGQGHSLHRAMIIPDVLAPNDAL